MHLLTGSQHQSAFLYLLGLDTAYMAYQLFQVIEPMTRESSHRPKRIWVLVTIFGSAAILVDMALTIGSAFMLRDAKIGLKDKLRRSSQSGRDLDNGHEMNLMDD